MGLEKEWSSFGTVKAVPKRRQKMSSGHFLRRGLPSPTLGTKKQKVQTLSVLFIFLVFEEWGSKRSGQVVGRLKPTQNADKKCPVDIFYDAACRGSLCEKVCNSLFKCL